MENNLKTIESECGTMPLGTEIVDIASDPNYIFVKDPGFNSLTLYDLDGNVVNVNSWIECAHYVNGGWSNVLPEIVSGDKLIFFIMSFLGLSYLTIRRIYKTKYNVVNDNN